MTARTAEATLHIFVNRRKFETGDGVKERMSGAEIAGLVDVPADNAVVRREAGPDQREIGIDEVIDIKTGDHFLVTRKIVEGGYGPGQN
jgi:Multiubiquitin